MKFKVFITQVWTFYDEIEARNREEADNIAAEIASELETSDMMFGDDYIEVEPIREER